MMKLDEQWVEILTLFFLVLGFVISVLLQNSLLLFYENPGGHASD